MDARKRGNGAITWVGLAVSMGVALNLPGRVVRAICGISNLAAIFTLATPDCNARGDLVAGALLLLPGPDY